MINHLESVVKGAWSVLSTKVLLVLAVVLGLAPFIPEPHLLEKTRMLLNGELTKFIDVFDLFWHSWPMLLLAVRLVISRTERR